MLLWCSFPLLHFQENVPPSALPRAYSDSPQPPSVNVDQEAKNVQGPEGGRRHGARFPSQLALCYAVLLVPSVTAHNLPLSGCGSGSCRTYKVQLSHPHMHTGSAGRHLTATSRSRSMLHRVEGRGSRSAGEGRKLPPASPQTLLQGTRFHLRRPSGGSFAAAAAVAVAVIDSKRHAGGSLEREEGSLVPPQHSSEAAEDAAGDGDEEEVDEGLMWGWEDEEEEPVSGARCCIFFFFFFVCVNVVHVAFQGLRKVATLLAPCWSRGASSQLLSLPLSQPLLCPTSS